MGSIASQITSLTVVYSTVYSDADKRKHQSSASLAFVWGIHWGPVNSPHKWAVTQKKFSFDDVTMHYSWLGHDNGMWCLPHFVLIRWKVMNYLINFPRYRFYYAIRTSSWNYCYLVFDIHPCVNLYEMIDMHVNSKYNNSMKDIFP